MKQINMYIDKHLQMYPNTKDFFQNKINRLAEGIVKI